MTRTQHGSKSTRKDRKRETETCLQSSPTLKMAACQQILLASSSLFTSSKESERHCRPERKMSRHTVCLSTHLSCTVSTLEGFNACSTFFLQLTDATPPNFEFGQVGSFGSTNGDTTRLLKSVFSLIFFHISLLFHKIHFRQRPTFAWGSQTCSLYLELWPLGCWEDNIQAGP